MKPDQIYYCCNTYRIRDGGFLEEEVANEAWIGRAQKETAIETNFLSSIQMLYRKTSVVTGVLKKPLNVDTKKTQWL